jgi:hypothetical protein
LREEITTMAAYLGFIWIGRRVAHCERRERPLFAYVLWNYWGIETVAVTKRGDHL